MLSHICLSSLSLRITQYVHTIRGKRFSLKLVFFLPSLYWSGKRYGLNWFFFSDPLSDVFLSLIAIHFGVKKEISSSFAWLAPYCWWLGYLVDFFFLLFVVVIFIFFFLLFFFCFCIWHFFFFCIVYAFSRTLCECTNGFVVS